MRPIELEVRVLEAVRRIKSGGTVENDLIECKRDWPTEDKARQLAGSLNRAAGDPVIYIIGIDETTGKVFDLSGTEVSDWWAQIQTKFDQALPEMIRHISVVTDDGEQVIAAAFASDRAPYMIKTGLAKPRLEIPIREGTATNTARRDQVLRMLIPTISVPPAVALKADALANLYEEHIRYSPMGDEETIPDRMHFSGSVRLYFEHPGNGVVTLPAHGMSGSLKVGEEEMDLTVAPNAFHSENSPPEYGVVRTPEAVVLTGPAAATIQFSLRNPDPAQHGLFTTALRVVIRLDLDVLYAIRPLSVEVDLVRQPARELRIQNQEELGRWAYTHRALY